MHAIQTSGNTIRNVTADHFAGAAADEIADPRIYAELIRQWSTDHPEFQFLPRKFKVAVTGAKQDRAVIHAHDIGLQIVEQNGRLGMRVIIGGGLGRTPMIGKVIREFLAMDDILPYLESVVSVWNLLGRRDNKYKARIKITIHENGIDEFSHLVDERFALIRPSFHGFDQTLLSEISDAFSVPKFQCFDMSAFDARYLSDPNFCSWVDTNVTAHKHADYAIATISLKSHGETPGDASSAQMRRIADLAETYSHNELRISHEQNIVLPHVHKAHLPDIYDALHAIGLDTANIGLISDIIACPGMDYCALATARSIPIAQDIATHFDALKLEHDIGPLKIKISGCINACGHHHVGHIGILGLDRAGVENYQITLGGDGTETPAIGERAGPGFGADEVIPAIGRLIHCYLNERLAPSETFLGCYRRLGLGPFKAALYETEQSKVRANAA